jgi:hypothetical protein
MKATHNKASEPDKVEWKFPCLGVTELGEVVAFFESGLGTVLVNPQCSRKLFELFENWNMAAFQPLPSTESVTLQND